MAFPMHKKLLLALACACASLTVNATPILDVSLNQQGTFCLLNLIPSGVNGAENITMLLDGNFLATSGSTGIQFQGHAGDTLLPIGQHIVSMLVDWGATEETVIGNRSITIVDNYIGVPDSAGFGSATIGFVLMFGIHRLTAQRRQSEL